MTSIRFDHFITYTNAGNIDNYLKEYESLGFVPLERTVRHDPGLRNGFISFGPEYIEFCWVEDETLFEAADTEEKLLRASPRPFGLGLIADDVQSVHDDWIARGFSVPEVWSKAPRDAPPETPPRWSFQGIPNDLMPGVSSFVLTYHFGLGEEIKQIRMSPNTIYAIAEVTLVTTQPESRASSWRDLLARDERVIHSGTGFDVWIGPHRATWMTPEDYQAAYGLEWVPSSHPNTEIGLLHLLASDLDVAKTMMEQAGRRTNPVSIRGLHNLLISPDVRDGFNFIIRQQPVEIWLQERIGRTGEKLELAMG